MRERRLGDLDPNLGRPGVRKLRHLPQKVVQIPGNGQVRDGETRLLDAKVGSGRGGAVAFTRMDVTDGSLLLFAWDRLHDGSPVRCDAADPFEGRWTMNGWLHLAGGAA